MKFTGERFMPEIHGSIELEHLHRYLFACKAVNGKTVLDIASGEGYGSAMLAKVARKVTGVDISQEAVLHAQNKYVAQNLEFIVGSCSLIPLESACVDVVVSFETIEHHDEHEAMMREIKRVLRPDGIVIISSPDKREYSDKPSYHNAHHVKELYREEFIGLLDSYFNNHKIYGQRVIYGSAILCEDGVTPSESYEYVDEQLLASTGVPHAVYLVAVASNAVLPVLSSGVLEQRIEDSEITRFWRKLMADRDEQITSLSLGVAERDEQIVNLNQAFSMEISRLNQTLSCIYASKSWRITEPLRQLNRIISALKGPHPIEGRAFNLMRKIFRRIPLSNSAKDRLRFWVVARSGIFAGYKQTSFLSGAKDHRESEGEFIEGTVDYVQFKRQLVHHISIKQTAWMPRREKLVSFEGKNLRKVASSISFDLTTNPTVTIIIPVYSNATLTLECLSSIQYSSVDTSYEIVVADDASTDETVELLKLIKGIKIHRNSENQGFLRNCNSALSLAVGDFVVFLNNDVQVTDGWLDGLLEVFSAHPNAGAVGPMIVYPSGHLQEAGVSLRKDGTADMVGLNDNPYAARFEYTRPVDYCSGACLIIRGDLIRQLGGFSDEFAPAYCEDADLCLRIIELGYKVYYTHRSKVIHHLSKTTAADGISKKHYQVSTNIIKLHKKWAQKLDELASVKVIAFYLPQFHRIPENDVWWGDGFTEWTNVTKAKPNYVGHYQPRVPADLGYYDLNNEEVMIAQAALARKYGIDGFCFYYYWFGGKRLLEMPVERMLQTGKPDFPYCLCWANENWSRRWDGRDNEILIGQQHSPEDDRAVILDLIRHFKSPNYIRIDGRPHLIVYRVDLFPDFVATSKLWRQVCREQGIGEMYISMVESHDLVHKNIHPSTFGCDAAIEFPPLNMAEQIAPSGDIINPDFHGGTADYRDTALRYCTRDLPAYTRFRGVMPGWDNTARRQNNGFCFENSSPEVFQAWMEHVIKQSREQHHGDERIIFVNAWNEWAEGAYLEPDSIHGHAFLEAVRNAKDAEKLLSVGN